MISSPTTVIAPTIPTKVNSSNISPRPTLTLRHDDAKIDIRRFTRGTAKSEVLLALTQPHPGSHALDGKEASDLPLVELQAAHPSGMLAIVISGDGSRRTRADCGFENGFSIRDTDERADDRPVDARLLRPRSGHGIPLACPRPLHWSPRPQASATAD